MWKTVKLGDVCNLRGGGTPSKRDASFYNGDIPWATVRDMKHDVLNDTEHTITNSGLDSSSSKIIPMGNVIIASRVGLGKVCILSKDTAINQDLRGVLPKESDILEVKYLFYWFKNIASVIISAGHGTTVQGVTLPFLKSLDLPLPPLDKQKQIAEILDQADELRRLRQCTIDRLNTLGQAIFYEMFGDPTTNSKGWKTGTIRDLIREAKYGTSKKANTDGCGIPVLRMSNVTYQGELDLSDLKHVELSETELQKYTAQEDDILFNRTNSKELVGKTAVFNLPNLMVLAGYLVRARVNEQADPYYISAYMNSLHGKTTLQNMCKNIVGMANINAQEFQNIAIAIPPIEKQKSFRKKIEKIAKQKESLLNELTMYKNLFSSLQQRAFRGEL